MHTYKNKDNQIREGPFEKWSVCGGGGGSKCLPGWFWGTLRSIRQCQRTTIVFYNFWMVLRSSTIVYDGLMVVHHRSNFATVTYHRFELKHFSRIIDTSPMRTTKTPPTLSMLSSFASVFLFVSCNIRIRSGLHQMTQLLKKKRTNFANTLLPLEDDDDDDHNEAMM